VITLLAKVDVPVTVKADVPAPRVMLLPLAMLKLATVCVARKSHTEVPLKVTAVALFKAPDSTKVPSDTVVWPEYVLLALKVNVPVPFFTNDPVPLTTPAIVDPLLTVFTVSS
jgi:hypothetical protein